MKNLFKLQNGTDIRGVSYKDENSDLGITLSEKEVKVISHGFALWLKKKYNTNDITISIGRDSRVTGQKFIDTSRETLINAGVNVIQCDLATTPAMFMSTIMDGYKTSGAIMFTASHMPYIYNGMKMFTSDGCLEKNDIKDILNLCQSDLENINSNKGNLIKKELLEDYSKLLSNIIKKGVNSSTNYDKPLEGMKIIVDAGNGSGGFYAEKVLKNLGADVEGSQFLDPDGMFPNHIPNPENKEAMDSISKATVNSNADLGIIFDTDVDRAAIVDSKGMEINKNSLIALISNIVLRENPGSTIVTDSVTSIGLNEYISEHGGVHHRFKRGYKNVINEAIRLNNEGISAPLAIETSGHAALKENYFLDDGAYLVSKIIINAAKMHKNNDNISNLISTLKQPKDSVEHRYKIEVDDFKSYGQEVIDSLVDYAKNIETWEMVSPNFEGVRFNCNGSDEKGWFLLRMSLHEPLLVLNIESDIDDGCSNLLEKICNHILKFEYLK